MKYVRALGDSRKSDKELERLRTELEDANENMKKSGTEKGMERLRQTHGHMMDRERERHERDHGEGTGWSRV